MCRMEKRTMKNYELTLCGVKRILPFVDLENDEAVAK